MLSPRTDSFIVIAQKILYENTPLCMNTAANNAMKRPILAFLSIMSRSSCSVTVRQSVSTCSKQRRKSSMCDSNDQYLRLASTQLLSGPKSRTFLSTSLFLSRKIASAHGTKVPAIRKMHVANDTVDSILSLIDEVDTGQMLIGFSNQRIGCMLYSVSST